MTPHRTDATAPLPTTSLPTALALPVVTATAPATRTDRTTTAIVTTEDPTP
ncbi:hypothetical protein [Streptomyces phaeochromogenes]|uniref:hypothetical protein n=1 Tax=Streptomyces phaeochromogenes TaxID=1923 RepID=UPI002E123571|nr:hypothetical protein OG437_01960 [Streptomyces phaeochromogenes]